MYHSVIQKIQSNEKNVFACSVLSLHTKDQTERDVAVDRTYLPGGEGESEGSSQVWHQSQILCLVLDDLHLFLILWAKLSATVRDGKYMCALFTCLNVFKMSLHTQKPRSQSHTNQNRHTKGVTAKGQTTHNTPGCRCTEKWTSNLPGNPLSNRSACISVRRKACCGGRLVLCLYVFVFFCCTAVELCTPVTLELPQTVSLHLTSAGGFHRADEMGACVCVCVRMCVCAYVWF